MANHSSMNPIGSGVKNYTGIIYLSAPKGDIANRGGERKKVIRDNG